MLMLLLLFLTNWCSEVSVVLVKQLSLQVADSFGHYYVIRKYHLNEGLPNAVMYYLFVMTF